MHVILTAMQHYGLILVDKARNEAVGGEAKVEVIYAADTPRFASADRTNASAPTRSHSEARYAYRTMNNAVRIQMTGLISRNFPAATFTSV